jgi:hypothetical protein
MDKVQTNIINSAENNAKHINADLDWLQALIDFRIKNDFESDFANKKAIPDKRIPVNEANDPVTLHIEPPVFEEPSFYSDILAGLMPAMWERALLALALAPHLRPAMLDVFFFKNKATGKTFTEFGGATGKSHPGFLPTAETFLYIVAGNNLGHRLHISSVFDPSHPFVQQNILRAADVEDGEPRSSGLLQLSDDFICQLLYGKKLPPRFGSHFPAKRISTEMNWSDLVLSPQTFTQISELKLWLTHYDRMRDEFGLRKKLKPGYRMLMHGPPGTGKTLTACLLGKETGREVYRVDLSAVVSKYIGETEKNLSKVFDKAERSGWILFFDEADALFGNRTKVDSSHDRYANQEVSYLLQRIEDYDGIVILCSNIKNNIDNAFLRRFQSIIHFPLPKAEERFLLWKKSFPEKIILADDINLNQVAQSYELTGSHIMNVVAHASLNMISTGSGAITMRQLRDSIARELAKEGRTF